MTLLSDQIEITQLSDIVFPDALTENDFNLYVQKGDFPNILLYGKPGSGKTELAHLMPKLFPTQSALIVKYNGGRQNGVKDIENLNIRLSTNLYAQSKFDKDIVTYDEVDLLSAEAIKRLKTVMDRHRKTARFICTTNHFDKIKKVDPAFINRVNSYCFDHQNYQAMCQRAVNILSANNLTLDSQKIMQLAQATCPSMRRFVDNLDLHAQPVASNSNHVPLPQPATQLTTVSLPPKPDPKSGSRRIKVKDL